MKTSFWSFEDSFTHKKKTYSSTRTGESRFLGLKWNTLKCTSLKSGIKNNYSILGGNKNQKNGTILSGKCILAFVSEMDALQRR